MENKLNTGAVFIDLRKAFDTVDHTLLIRKLKHIGLSEAVINWFSSYLSLRTAVTSINNITSSPKPVTVGVPQGSILGPLLFLIYINELPQCLKHCKSILYADDTLIYYTARTETELQDKINEDLNSLYQWLNNNLLTLNYEKTKFMIFANKKQPTLASTVDICIQTKKILQEKSLKYLGVTLTSDLTWHEHVDNIMSKINQRLGLL